MLNVLLVICFCLVNPGLQPGDLCDRARAIALLKVEANAAGEARLSATAIWGPPPPTTIHLKGEPAELATLVPGQTLVAWIGDRRHPEKVLAYVGAGHFALAEAGADPAAWTLRGDADRVQGNSGGSILFGTFNGRSDRLAELVVEHQAKRGYFPAIPYSAFSAGTVSPRAGGPIALADLDGDGVSEGIWAGAVQRRGAAGAWTAGPALPPGVTGSCSVADLDGDGRVDLLVGGTILINAGQCRFTVGPILSPGAVRQSLVAELDGDGRPDVVVVDRAGQLHAWLNRASGWSVADAAFAPALGQLGLSDVGAVTVADLDSDGRCDLFLTAGAILLQSGAMQFEGVPLGRGSEGWRAGPGLPAAGALWRGDSESVAWAGPQRNHLIAWEEGPVDVARYGNELQDAIPSPGPALAVDLGADGPVDLYVAGGGPGQRSRLATNRGYGSFLMEEKYTAGRIVPPAVYNDGASALAAADVDGDGDVDLLVATAAGPVVLLINQACEKRAAEIAPETLAAESWRIRLRLVEVRPSGPGSIGAVLTVSAGERVLARRRIDGGQGDGGREPSAIIALPADATALTLRFADGVERPVPLPAAGARRSRIVVAHP